MRFCETLFSSVVVLNAVTFSGRIYDDTRMDTSWAFRQAYESCSVSLMDC